MVLTYLISKDRLPKINAAQPPFFVQMSNLKWFFFVESLFRQNIFQANVVTDIFLKIILSYHFVIYHLLTAVSKKRQNSPILIRFVAGSIVRASLMAS